MIILDEVKSDESKCVAHGLAQADLDRLPTAMPSTAGPRPISNRLSPWARWPGSAGYPCSQGTGGAGESSIPDDVPDHRDSVRLHDDLRPPLAHSSWSSTETSLVFYLGAR